MSTKKASSRTAKSSRSTRKTARVGTSRKATKRKATKTTPVATYTPKMPKGFTSEQYTFAKRKFAAGYTAKETYDYMQAKWRKIPTQSAVSHAWIGYKRASA